MAFTSAHTAHTINQDVKENVSLSDFGQTSGQCLIQTREMTGIIKYGS